jgi:hypothetical protein
MNIFGKKFDDKKVKKIIYTAVLAVLVIWFVFRFVMVALESRMDVFNPMRDESRNGTLVEYVTVKKQSGTIGIPISVQNNRAYVSGARRAKLRVGQKIGDGAITYVSSSLDLDSGMYVVKTRGVSDGINNAEIDLNCYFVPAYAVHDSLVFVADLGIARAQKVIVSAIDSDMACISDGIKDGDKVIISHVTDGQKINIK